MSSTRFIALLLAGSLGLADGAFADDATPDAPDAPEEDVDARWKRPMSSGSRWPMSSSLTTSRRIFDVSATAGGFSVTQVYDGLAPATEDVIALDAAVGAIRAGARSGSPMTRRSRPRSWR